MPAPPIHLGSSSFTADGWQGAFYPKNLKSSDRLSFYSTRFDTVEIDSTFYGTPSPKTVQNWYDQTPPNFLFSLKVPNIITHDKLLEDTDADLAEFLDTASILKEKLGPLVFQFPFFEKIKLPTQRDFLDLLEPFLAKLPPDKKFAVEIRNSPGSTPLSPTSSAATKSHSSFRTSPLCPRPTNSKFDPITTDWTYIRWLGDRKWIEGNTVKWDKPVIDRTPQLMRWIDFCFKIRHRGVTIYAYANNHYTGFSPHTIDPIPPPLETKRPPPAA